MSDSELEPEAEAATVPSATDERLDADDRLRPEFVRAVIERVEAGDEEGARALVEPLHPAERRAVQVRERISNLLQRCGFDRDGK